MAASDRDRVVVVPPGEGPRTGNVRFLALSEHTPRFNLALITMEPGRHGPPPHVHQEEDDSFLILEGELTFLVGDDELPAPPETFVLVPPGIEHTFENRGSVPVRMVSIHAPAGFDRRMLND